MERPEGDAPWEEYLKYILYLENDNKLLGSSNDKFRLAYKELRKYASHSPHCKKDPWHDCSCGLDKLF